MILPVSDVYLSIQGEATWTGTPAVFIRLQGCEVGCPFCDVPHSWDLNPEREVTLGAMLAKEVDSNSYAAVGTATLVSTVKSFGARHVVITGGEPCRYDLYDLTKALASDGMTVQIETSGTEPVKVYGAAWITVSPKPDMPGGRPIIPAVVVRASEIKAPIGRTADIDRFLRFWHGMQSEFTGDYRPPIWLQPLSTSPAATRLCINACTRYGWRVSLQTQKLIGVR